MRTKKNYIAGMLLNYTDSIRHLDTRQFYQIAFTFSSLIKGQSEVLVYINFRHASHITEIGISKLPKNLSINKKCEKYMLLHMKVTEKTNGDD